MDFLVPIPSFKCSLWTTPKNWMPDDCLATFWWLPMTHWRLPDDCLMTMQQLPDNCHPLPDNCLMTAWQLPDAYLPTSLHFCTHWRLTTWWLPKNCLKTTRHLPDDPLITVWWLPDNCLTSACLATWRLLQYWQTTRQTKLYGLMRLPVDVRSLKIN